MNCETALIASQFILANSDSLGEKISSLQRDSKLSLACLSGVTRCRNSSMDSSLAAEGHNTTCYCSDVVSITKRYFTLLLRVRLFVLLNVSLAVSSISPRVERVRAELPRP